jgi:hypothetical protein
MGHAVKLQLHCSREDPKCDIVGVLRRGDTFPATWEVEIGRIMA